MSKRDLSPEEQALWHKVTEDVTPLGEAHIPRAPRQTQVHGYTPVSSSMSGSGRRKRRDIEAAIDLHGMTQSQAEIALRRFIFTCHAQQKRSVLVITGKGYRQQQDWWERSGVLREAVPRWLREEPLRSHIIDFSVARPEQGGAGALHILIKRVKPL
ncbi:MAG: Smr/MutS family protein [Alphaproteobacteria bacterium]